MTEMLYFSSVDVSVPNGPGVNEVQFICAAAREYGLEAKFVIPVAAFPLPDNFPHEQTVFVRSLNRRSLTSWFKWMFSVGAAGHRLISECKPRYIVFRLTFLPLAEAWLAHKAKCAVFVKTVGDTRFTSFRRSAFTLWLVPLLRVSYGLVFRRANAADVVSDILRDELQNSYRSMTGRVRVFDNAADTILFQPISTPEIRETLGLTSFKHLVGYVGNLAHERGAVELIESWKYLLNREEVGLLVVSGDGKGIEELKSRAKKLGIGDRLIVRGPVPIFEVSKYMNALDVGVSFREDDGCAELKVRQYLACGVPVVASAKVNAFLDSAEVGMCVPRTQLEEIGLAISKMMVDEPYQNPTFLRRYAEKHLSYDASVADRREFWLEQSHRASGQ